MSECNIVKDLMPLCIDGVASEDSRKLVTDHVGKCEKCAAVYADYQKELPAKEPCMNYGEAARALRKWRRMRRMLLISLVVVLTLTGVVGGMYAWDKLTLYHTRIIAVEDYTAHLVRTRSDEVFMIVVPDKEGLDIGLSGSGMSGEITFEVKTTTIPQYGKYAVNMHVGTWRDGAIWAQSGADSSEKRTSIRISDGKNSRAVYAEGDDVPLVSAEYEALHELSRSFYAGGKGNGLTDEQQAAYDAQYALVPEFQPE